MRSIINILDLSAGEIDQLIAVADDIMAQPEKYNEVCRHKILATLFFEPSTRTRLSFESAMLSLGGQVIGFSGADSSSAVKGETIADTIEVVNGYADIIAMRHPKEGAPVVASMHTAVPLINAGDGGHFHPTQTLADLLTIHHEKGALRLDRNQRRPALCDRVGQVRPQGIRRQVHHRGGWLSRGPHPVPQP